MPPTVDGHSATSPSASERWWNCPGSVGLCDLCPPSKTSKVAADGTAAHGLAEELVTGKADVPTLMARIGSVVKDPRSGYDIEITEEMVDAVVEYWDTIASDIKFMDIEGRPTGVVAKAEVKVMAKSVDPQMKGTCDYLLYQKGNVLRVYDFKYGQGVVVEPEENKQLAIYAVAAMDTEAGWAYDEVELVIVQPRAPHLDGPVRRWSEKITWFQRFRDELKQKVEATRIKGAMLAAGEHCRWCPARASCPTMCEMVEKQVQMEFSVIPDVTALPLVEIMPVEKLALALQWEGAINSWYEGLKQRAREILEAGLKVPGYKLVEGRSNRRWVNEERVIEELSPVLGEDALFERKLLSPAKLEKIVGKGKLEEMGLTEKPEGPKAIAPDKDPRPAAKRSAVEDFGVVPPASATADVDTLLGEITGTGVKEEMKHNKVWPD